MTSNSSKDEQKKENSIEPEQEQAEAEQAKAKEAEEENKQPSKKKRGSKKGEELEKLKAEKEEYLNALVRERADFENYKRRNQVAVSQAYQSGSQDAAAKMLPVMDNLERALASTVEDSPLRQGVQMVLNQCIDALKSLGIEEIEADGQAFDPAFHNAVMQVEAKEGQQSGMIQEVLMKGYKCGDKVLRHSMVKVVE